MTKGLVAIFKTIALSHTCALCFLEVKKLEESLAFNFYFSLSF